MRKFNTEGPIVAADHYHVPPLERIDLGRVLDLIRDKRYFVLRAPRQTGKTSALLALRDLLNGGSEGGFRCVYVNVEAAQAAREDVGRAMQIIVGALASRARKLGDRFLYEAWPGIFATFGDGALGEALARVGRGRPEAAGGADRRDRLPDRRHPDRRAPAVAGQLRPASRRLPAERGAVRRARRARLPDVARR